MSPLDRSRWLLLQNERRELRAHMKDLCQTSLKLVAEMDRVDKIIREDEKELAALASKYDEKELAALGVKEDLNGGES